jgi:hypothetical protein
LRCSQIGHFKLSIHIIFKIQQIRTTFGHVIFNVKTRFRTSLALNRFSKMGAANSSSPRFAYKLCRFNEAIKRNQPVFLVYLRAIIRYT